MPRARRTSPTMTPTPAMVVSHWSDSPSTCSSYGSGRSIGMAGRQQGHDDQDDPQTDGHGRPPETKVDGGQQLAHEEEASDENQDQPGDQATARRVGPVVAPGTGRGSTSTCLVCVLHRDAGRA